MRLKPEKIEQLTELIYDHLATIDEVALHGERSEIVFLIRNVITEDLQAEDDIEAEARRLLEEHEDDLRRVGASWDQMLRKTKQKIARDRGVVL